MKPNELSIGDWVLGSNGLKHTIVGIDIGKNNRCAVTVRVMEGPYSKGDLAHSTDVVLIEELKPIPITLEILEKNGYTNDELSEKVLQNIHHSHKTIHHLTSEDRRVSICDNDEWLNSNNTWFVHVDTEDMRTMATIELTYVHELQHILRHCEIEKEIVL